MKGMNLAILAAILIVKTVKILGGPTNLFVTDNFEDTDVPTPAYISPDTTDESPGSKKSADFNFNEPELPQDKFHGKDSSYMPSKLQQNSPNEPGQTATRATARQGLNSSTSPPCPNCKHQDDDELERLFRIERFKNRILQKLQMTKPPNISKPLTSLPNEVFDIAPNQKHHHRGIPEKAETRSKIYLFADENGCNETSEEKQITDASPQCFKFPVSPAPEEQTLASAQLWVYLPPIDTTTKQLRDIAAALPEKYYDARYTIAVKEDFVGEGWVELPLRHAIKRFERSQHYIEVQSKPTPVGSEGPTRPILALTYAMKNRERRGSNQNPNAGSPACNTAEECCMMPLRINFADSDWNFIIQPNSYQANYCKGVCNTTRPNGEYRSSHSNVLTTWQLNRPEDQRFLPSCCQPSSFDSLYIIFQNENGIVNRTTLSDMTVRGCHCVVP